MDVSAGQKTFWSFWKKWDASIWGLVVANFVPVFGIVFFDWDGSAVVFIYWSENLIVGFYNILKMILALGGKTVISTILLKVYLIPFFVVHFGAFCFGHGMFLLMLTEFSNVLWSSDTSEPGMWEKYDLLENSESGFDSFPFLEDFVNLVKVVWWEYSSEIAMPLLAMLISHGIMFYTNYIQKGLYLERDPALQMMIPYGRIVLMHIAIIFTGIPAILFGSPIPLLLILVAEKIAIDIQLNLWTSP